MQSIGELARGVLADCERAMRANGMKVSGDLRRPEGIERPGAARQTQQAPGSHITVGGRGDDHATANGEKRSGL